MEQVGGNWWDGTEPVDADVATKQALREEMLWKARKRMGVKVDDPPEIKRRMKTGGVLSDYEMVDLADADIPEAKFPQVTAWGQSLAGSLLSTGNRLLGSDYEADMMQMHADVYRQAAAERDQQKQGILPPTLKRGIRGAAETVPTMIVAGQIAGPYGAIAAASATEGNQAITEGRLAGLKGAKLAGYAAAQGAIEGSIAAAMQKVGLGGAESMVSAKQLASASVGSALKRFGISTLEELPEEIATELGHSVATAVSGVDKNATSKENLKQVVIDTTVQTLITMGMIEGPAIASVAAEQHTAKRAQKEEGERKAEQHKRSLLLADSFTSQPEVARGWAEANPEVAAEVAAQPTVSEEDWSRMRLPPNTTEEQRNRFGNNVRKYFREKADNEAGVMSRGARSMSADQTRFQTKMAESKERELWSNPEYALHFSTTEPDQAKRLADSGTYLPKDFEDAGLPAVPDAKLRKQWKGWVSEAIGLPEDVRSALQQEQGEFKLSKEWSRVPEGVDPPTGDSVETYQTSFGSVVRLKPKQERKTNAPIPGRPPAKPGRTSGSAGRDTEGSGTPGSDSRKPGLDGKAGQDDKGTGGKDTDGSGKKKSEEPTPPTTPEPSTPQPERREGGSPHVKLSRRIADHLKQGNGIDKGTLFAMADEEHGGSRSEGKYGQSEAYDSLETGINLWIRESGALRGKSTKEAVAILDDLKGKIVSQTKRSGEKESLQQFSTPPAYALAAVDIAGVHEGDVALEPSAGTGDIAVHMKERGATVHANEYSERRAELLGEIADEVTTLDAEHADTLLHGIVEPDVIVMNPPFSHAGHKFGGKTISGMDRRHVSSALKLLKPGGRLVAIMGAPMRSRGLKNTQEGVGFRKWWDQLVKDYNVRANVIVSDDVYKGYGTTFPTRLLVVDKPQTGQAPASDAIIGKAADVNELLDMLEGVKNDRQPTQQVRPEGSRKGGGDSTGGNPPVDGAGTAGNQQPGKSTRSEQPGSPGSGRTGRGSRKPGGGKEREGDSGNGGKRSDGDKPTGSGKDDAAGNKRPSGDQGGKNSSKPSAPEPESQSPPSGLRPGSPEWIRWKASQRKGGSKPAAKSKGTKKPAASPPATSSENPSSPKPQEPKAATPPKSNKKRILDDIKKYLDGDALTRVKNVDAMADARKYTADEVLDDPKMLGLVSELVGAAFDEGPHDFRSLVEEVSEAIGLDATKQLGPGLEWAWNLVRDEADTDGKMSPVGDVQAIVKELQGDEEPRQLGDDTFQPYTPSKEYPGAKKHPGALVESAAMAAVDHPEITYELDLSDEAVAYMSPEQLEQIAMCCQAHEGHLTERKRGEIRDWSNDRYPSPSRVTHRRGYLIGDGTGVGKTIELLGVIQENRRKGRKKAIVVTASEELTNQMRRDWENLGENPDDIFTKPGNWDAIDREDGILVIAYSSLNGKSQGSNPVRRLNQIVDWMGAESDNVICYDESHNMANLFARTGKALAGVELADTIPDARVLYLSATAGVELEHLSYCDRLGLWGPGTEFADAADFVGSLGLGEIAAMECCSQSMKAMGLYMSRGVAFRVNNNEDDPKNVQLAPVTHEMTDDQKAIYNRIAEAWAATIDGFNSGARETGQGRWESSHFYAEQLRFFNLLVTAIKMPTVIQQIEEDLANNLSVFIQVQDTGQAALDRAVAALPNETDPSEAQYNMIDGLVNLVERHFPTQQYEEIPDPNDPDKVIKRPMIYPPGHPKAGQKVENPAAVAMRDALIEDLQSIPAPETALDQLVNYFGPEDVAEISGRTHRIVDHGGKREYQKINKKRRMSEHKAFQKGDKRIAVVSRVGSTGFDFHAGLDVENQQRRAHYMLQPGWSAIQALQSLGRTHRTNQASAPIVRPISTSIPGEKRFISTIARRIAQAGAISKGQRQASGDLYKPSDNLESREARAALSDLFHDIVAGDVEGMSQERFEELTNLRLVDQKGNVIEETARNTARFFNRVLALPLEMQETLFNHYAERLENIIAEATAAGTLDTGVQTLKADRVEKVSSDTIYQKGTAEVQHVELKALHKNKPITSDDAIQRTQKPIGFYRNVTSGKIYFFGGSDLTKTDPKTGRVYATVRRQGILRADNVLRRDMDNPEKYERIKSPDEAREIWASEAESAPEFSREQVHLISGALLPIWKKIGGNPRIERVTLPDGEQIIGRRVRRRELDSLLTKLGSRNRSKISVGEVAGKLNGSQPVTVVLGNQWKIDIVRRDGERRIRLTGPSFASEKSVTSIGVFKEKAGGKTEYFIPTGDGTESVLQQLDDKHKIINVQEGDADTDTEPDEQGLGIGGASGSPSRVNMPANMAAGDVSDGAAVGASEIIDSMSKWFGVKIKFGRLPNKRLRGIYKRLWMVARGRRDESGSIDVAAHEIAHGIDQRTDVRSSLAKGSAEIGELRSLDYGYPDEQRPSEGFAEFVRGWLTEDIDVAEVAPKFTEHFESWLSKPENKKWRDAFYQSKEMVDRYRSEGALGRVKGQLAEVGDRDRSPLVHRMKKMVNDVYQKMFNQAWYAEQFEGDLKSRGYKPGKGRSFMDLYRAWNQGGATLANTALESGVFTMEGDSVKRLSEGLWDSLSKISDEDYGDWVAWAYARHAMESWVKGKHPGITMQDARAVYERFRDREGWSEAADSLTEFNNALVYMLADTGVISMDSAKRITEAYKTYLPLMRIVPDTVSSEGVGGLNLVDFGSPIKGRTGSGYRVIDPVQSTIKRAIQFYERAAAQAVTNEMIRASVKAGANGWIERIPPRMQTTQVSLSEVWSKMQTVLEDAGMSRESLEELIENGLDLSEVVNVFRPNYWGESGKPEVRVMINGRPAMFWIHVPELHRMITGMGYFQLPKLLDKSFGNMTRMIRAGATTLNPTFVARNFLRDMPTYIVQRDYGGVIDPMKWVVSYAASEVSRRTGSTENPFVETWRKYGGQLSSVLGSDRASVRRAVQSAVSGKQKFGTMETITDMMQVTEAGPRLAEFVGVWKKHGWTEAKLRDAIEKGELPRDVLVESLNAAHEVTVDFRRAGEYGKWLTRMIPFLNANIQGVDKHIRTWKNNPARTMARVMGLSVIPSIVYWFMHKDEDWYKERENWMNAYWVITDGNGKPIGRIPRGHELAQIGAGVEAILDALNRENPEAITEWLKTAFKQTRPGLNISGAGSLLEVMMNYDFFRDAPIVPEGVDELKAGEQYTRYNTALMKVIGQHIGVSPAKLEHVVNSTTGGLYRRASKTLIDSWWSDDPLSAADIPIVEGFVFRGEYTRSVDEFYDKYEDIKAERSTAKARGRKVSPEDEATFQRLNRIRGIISELRAAARERKGGRDDKFEVERYITGLSRMALEKDEMERYPSPFSSDELPKDVQAVIDDHVGRAAYSTARIAALGATTDEERRKQKSAEEFLESTGMDEGAMSRILTIRLRKMGYGTDAQNSWRKRLRARVDSGDR